MKGHRLMLATLLISATSAYAQQPQRIRPEIRPFIAAYLPAGALRDDFKSATTLGAQAALEISPFMHVVGTVGWTHGHNKYANFSDDVTYIWQYDVGAEFNLTREWGSSWLLKPFLGAGAGGRTYDYQAVNVGTNTCTAGYSTIGSELQKGVMALRFEARNYITWWRALSKPLVAWHASPLKGSVVPRDSARKA
jgi:hypothetical protein